MTGQWHPDATALAEYRAGLTRGRRARRLAAHVATCASCATVNDELAAVTTVLASAPEPAMPDAVERQIMAALAAEAAHSATAHSTAHSTAPSPVGNGSGPRRPDKRRSGAGSRWLRPAVLASAAAACLVLLGGAYGITRLAGGGSSSSSAASAAAGGAAAGSAAAGSESSALAGAAAPGTHTRQEPANADQPAAFVVTASGTRYEPPTLAAQVRAELARPAKSGTQPSASLAACALHLTGQARPSLVDRATYQGKPAYVIAVANWAWVVGPGCTASNPELMASVGL